MRLTAAAKEFIAKNQNKKIVFTNGCFDILHAGHITYLKEAKALGDLLFIGLNSDQSVKILKGPQRPVNNQADRKLILENLRMVDCVEIFEEETPLDLIKLIRPSILVKGGDWSVDKIVGADFVIANGGQVFNLSFVDGKSTTKIIEKIRLN